MDERRAPPTYRFLWRRLTAAKLAIQLLKRDRNLSARQRSLVETVSTAVDDVTGALLAWHDATGQPAPAVPRASERDAIPYATPRPNRANSFPHTVLGSWILLVRWRRR